MKTVHFGVGVFRIALQIGRHFDGFKVKLICSLPKYSGQPVLDSTILKGTRETELL